MNKQTKAALAAGAGALLLLGGAGSLAYWHDETDIGGNAEIQSGTLALDDCAAGGAGWSDVSPDATTGGPIADITQFLLVPGDTLEYTCDSTITASGDNLQATLTADTSTISGDAALIARLDKTVTATVGGAPIAANTITSADDNAAIQVKVRLHFQNATGDGVGNGGEAQNSAVNLSAMKLVLQQNTR
ncbi:alternate-type signal peptide domain-containing protein [Rhodococcus pseudokoreensis]|uniref:Alternate-type signal peptide domain-containing protein n=1 Tax=Rhodococcus pseudokoreensis TaxID=2811421 RepID=A0A974W8L8_9NOCA|nr:alternate-type signal peptide domain-containing protein [Rhodococcus pseudokoreensis]QSE93293.1 alternate-type signal peptide domain-containing protein [Rhodococcus pseudokoreensis]